MLPAVPLPTWSHLPRLFSGAETGARVMAGPWLVDKEDRPLWFSRSCWAMKAIFIARRALFPDSFDVWLPAYFCNQSTAPLRLAGAAIRFYPVTELGEPDWHGINQMIANGATPGGIFFLVHNFGFKNNELEAAKEFCQQQNCWLIEDCAHCLAPQDGIGETGDFRLFSPHKTLASPDGAVTICRDKALFEALTAARGSLCDEAPSASNWRIKRLIQTTLPEFIIDKLNKSRPLPDFLQDPDYHEPLEQARMSATARRMLSLKIDIETISARRRENAEILWRTLAGKIKCEPLYPLDQSPAPYRLALYFDDAEQGEKAFKLFQQAGLPVDSWPDLAPEHQTDPEIFANAVALRRQVVCLPVHQSLNPDELSKRLQNVL